MNNVKSFSPCEGITVYDDAYNHQDHDELFYYCKLLPFQIGWNDSLNLDEQYLHSFIDHDGWNEFEDIENSKNKNPKKPECLIEPHYNMLKVLNHHPIFSKIDKNKITKSTVNLDTIADSHTKHTHPVENVILYYANTEWQDGWGGETKFYDKHGKNIIYSSPYTPNRLIHFDGTIVHSFNPPTAKANKYRFSISTFYQRT